MPRKSRQLVLKPEYVTREMLADLRDEIEEILERSEHAINRADRDWKRLRNAADKAEQQVGRMEASVRDMRAMFDPDPVEYRQMRHEPVSWSYFHAWIARINQRLEQLEKNHGPDATRTSP